MNIERIYNEVVTGCKYDFEVASKHNMEMISSDVKASDLPHIEADFVTLNHVGCCIHYGEYGNELFFRGFLSHPIKILEEGE